MRRSLLAITGLLLAGSVLLMAQAPPAQRGGGARGPATDPTTPVFWSAQRTKEMGKEASGRVSPTTNMAAQSLAGVGNMIYRVGDSGSEIHEKAADFIFVHEGEGAIVMGGKIVDGKTERADEIRGTSIDGGTRYPVGPGDSMFIPAGAAHQFFVEKGKHFLITIVKIPKP